MNVQRLFRLGSAVEELRKAAGRSQKEVAIAAGLDQARLCALEKGRSAGPRQEVVARLAQALSLTSEQSSLLATIAARDRVMREATRNLPPKGQELIAAALDVVLTLTGEDIVEAKQALQTLVSTRARLHALSRSGSTRPQDAYSVFLDAASATEETPIE